MKIIKNTFFSLLILFVGSSLITSCSKDDETNTNVSENSKVSSYLKSFYPTNYQLGKSVDTKIFRPSSSTSRSKEFDNFVITEVFVGNDTMARGYIITDKSTNDFLYFIDVDRVDFKLTSVKIETNDAKVFENIDYLDKYLSTDKFDYIKIAEDYASGSSNVEVSKFWGWGPSHPSGDCNNGRDYWVHTYYVIGIGVSTTTVPDVYGEPLWSPCGEYVNP
jgi:hypothetical protein